MCPTTSEHFASEKEGGEIEMAAKKKAAKKVAKKAKKPAKKKAAKKK